MSISASVLILSKPPTLALADGSTALQLTACGVMSRMKSAMPVFERSAPPARTQVPAGNKAALEAVSVGDITDECRDKATSSTLAPGMTLSMTECVFVGPNALLNDRSDKPIGKYYGPPATWAVMDGSKFMATQRALTPSNPTSLALQLVKATQPWARGPCMA